MEKIKFNKCLRCGKTIGKSISNDSSADNLAHDRLRYTPTGAMPCSIDSQISASKAWQRINSKKKIKRYCAKCSIITSIGKLFRN